MLTSGKNIVQYCIVLAWFMGLSFHKICAQADTFSNNKNFEQYDAPKYFNDLYNTVKPEFAFKAKTKADFFEWQKVFLPKLKYTLGLNILEHQYANYVIHAQKNSTEDMGYFILEKWTILTEPNVPLPMVVLIPKNKLGKLPLVITTHGHGKDSILYDGIYPRIYGRNNSDSSDETLAIQAVKQGYITIAPTIRAFGNTRTEEDKIEGKSFSCHTQLMRDLLVGRTPIGDRVWDIQKILDWALKQFDVDEKRIAITGNSGGGTVSLFAAACDNRIKVVVPSSYFCTFIGSIGSIAHCDCNYIPDILNLSEMSDIAGLIAPRPLCILHGVKDQIFPISETRKAFTQLKKIYAVSGNAKEVELYEGSEGHQYYKEGAWPFIKKYFNKND